MTLTLSNFTPLSVAAAAASNYSPDEWFQRIVVDCGLLLELLVVQWGRGGGGPWWFWWLVTAKAAVFSWSAE